MPTGTDGFVIDSLRQRWTEETTIADVGARGSC
jgi:hypothetical protein